MKQLINKKKLNQLLINIFIVLLLLTIFSYINQSIFLLVTGKKVFWTMSRVPSTNFLFKYFPLVKDVVLFFLFFLLLSSDKDHKYRNIVISIFELIIYGVTLLFLNNNAEFGYIFSGIRIILYSATIILFCSTTNIDAKNREKIDKIIKDSIIVEFLIVFIYVLLTDALFVFGSGGYRFTGTFGNAANLGYFTVACSLYLIISKYSKNSKNKRDYLYFILLLLMSVATGSRVSILTNLLVLLCYIDLDILAREKIKKGKLLFFNILGLIIVLPIIYVLLIDKINRGSFLVSGTYRIEVFTDILSVNNINDVFALLFGRGIGYATNSAFILGTKGAYIVDGTFQSIILQYGLFGLILLISVIYKTIKKYDLNIFILTAIIGSFLLLSLAINIFEQFAFIVLSIYSLSLLKNKIKKQ